MLALGKLRITSEGSTWTMLSAVRSRLTASASPEARSAVTKTSRFCDSTPSFASMFAAWPAVTFTVCVKASNPT